MMPVKRSVALLLALVCLLGLGSARAETKKYSTTFYGAFDTVITIIGYADKEETFESAAETVQDMFLYYHQIYDGYTEYEGVHNLWYVNENAAKEPVQAEKELIEILLWMKDVQSSLPGRVNIAMGAVLNIWHECREEGTSLPDTGKLKEASLHTSFDDVIIDEEKGTVYFADPLLRLDLGAVAKGYTVERVAEWLDASAMPSYIISAGGNVRCGAKPLDGRLRWGVGIQDPGEINGSAGTNNLDVMYMTDLSAVTSGDYQRYYFVDGVRYHHIIDPDTLYPSDFMRSVTVVTKDSGLADALSTTLFLLSYEAGRELVEGMEGVEAYWVLMDGTVVYTDGMAACLASQGARAK